MPLLRILLLFLLTLGLQASIPKKNDLLQLKIPGGIAGFSKQSVYMVHGFSALRISFLGSSAVKPIKQEQKILYANLYKGIDLSYDGTKGLKSTYTIHPHANPSAIHLRYNAKVEIDKNGNLLLSLPTKERLKVTKPIAWQMQKGKKLYKEVAFKTIDEHTVSFILKSYDPSKPLYIDPTYQWHTFYGDGKTDAMDIATDGNGNIYVLGSGKSSLGLFNKAPLHADGDTVIMKFESNGSLDWYTFYGDSFHSSAFIIMTDGIYVVGEGNNWDVNGTAPLHPYSGNYDITILKLDKNGNYQWHTFYGSDNADYGNSIAVDESGIYVTGESYSSWDVNGTAPLHSKIGSKYSTDIVILKLDKNGNYKWHTFYGSDYSDSGSGIAVDDNDVYVTGDSQSSWDVNGTAPLHPHSGDITILKLNKNGAYQWHTFYGGGEIDESHAIAVDESGVYVTGYSNKSWDVNGTAPLHPYSGGDDITILKLDKNGHYQWHTFYGSGNWNWDRGESIAIDESGVYVTGYSDSWDVNGTAPLHPYSGNNDITILKLDKNGNYQWHTFYGSDGGDRGNAIAVDKNGVYVTGYGNKSWEVNGTAPLHPHSGDITILKLDKNGAYQWHTFYGVKQGGDDYGYAIAVDAQNHIYVTGSSQNWYGPHGEKPLHPYSAPLFGYSEDIYILALDKNGNYQWHTFYGSGDDDEGTGIAVDESGVYVTGYSEGSWDVNGTAPLHPYSGNDDITILKLDKNGNYQWHTFYGSGDDDEGEGIAVDESGVYVTGYSEGSWDVSGTVPLHPYSDKKDITILKLDKNGNYQWHTFYGSDDRDVGTGIAVDESGVYVTGYSEGSWDVNGTAPLHPDSGGYDITILKLDKNGNYQWHTFYGSNNHDDDDINEADRGLSIAVDDSDVYITGVSQYPWDVNGTKPLHSHSGWIDITILKLDKNGNYQWHTFYGSGKWWDVGKSIAIDEGGIYVTGFSDDYWDVNGTAPLHPYSRGRNITILKLDKNGTYQWHTFYGGSGSGDAITIKNFNLYVTGYSMSPWLGDNDAKPLHRYINDDLFVLKLRDAVNHPPMANDDNATTSKDIPVSIDVLANDSDPDGDTLNIASVSNPSHGNAAIQAGKVLYTPNASFIGTDSFTYTISDGHGGSASATVIVTVTVSHVNHPPVANDDSFNVIEEQSTILDLLANDSDPDGDILTITHVSNPSHGTVTIVQGGAKVQYTPEAGFYGASDSFTYTIADGHGNTSTATANVTINVQEADGDNSKEDPNDDINHDGTKDYLQKYISTPEGGTHKIGVAVPSDDALDHVQKEEGKMSVTTEDGSHITLPYGTLSFKVHVVHSGDSAQITIYYPYNPAIQGYVKQIAGVWKKVPSTVVHDQANHQTRVTFTLTDGGDFDIDGSADGVITDPGGGYITVQVVTVPLALWAKLLMFLGFIFFVSYYKKELEA